MKRGLAPALLFSLPLLHSEELKSRIRYVEQHSLYRNRGETTRLLREDVFEVREFARQHDQRLLAWLNRNLFERL